MSRIIEYFPTNGFGVTKESLIKCDMCGCESCDESEIGWQRLGGMDYCPKCWERTNDVILTSDGKLWDWETKKEIIKVKEE